MPANHDVRSIRSLLDAIPHPIAVVHDGVITIANPALSALLGGGVEGKPLAEVTLPPAFRVHQEPLEDGSIMCSFLARDAGIGALLDRLNTDDAARLLLGERHDPVSITDAGTGRFVDVNAAWCEQYGYTREEAIGAMGPADVSAEPAATAASVAQRASGGGITGPMLRWHRRKDGSVFPVELSCGSMSIGGRTLVYARLRDVEERVRAEEALRRSEENYRTLIEQLPYAVVVHRDERILYVNAAARRLLGLPLDEDLADTPLYEMVHPEDRALAAGRVRGNLYRGEPAPPLEERLVRRDGSIVPVEVVGIPTLFDGRPAGLAIGQDVTARRAMEARLVMSDRLASLGRLAASIGHEINNPLMYVLGSLELLRHELEKLGLPQLKERLDAAEQGTLRVRDIVRDLRVLARSPEEDGGPAELSRTLGACLQMAGHELRHRAHLVCEQHAPVWVRGSEARLGQVFLNLLVNAAQSIEAGSVDDNEVRVHVETDAGEAIVEIADTGQGLPVGREGHLFEPFFTTKHGTGIGLGLSICHQIVTSLGGRIEAERRPLRGSVFTVRLPLAERPPASSVPAALERTADGARVLIVDDEPEILDVLCAWLRGYDVRTARSGREAIERFEREGPFDAVVCDLMMGDLTGMDVHARIGDMLGEGRMIFTTGGAYTERARSFLEARSIEPLLKPFRREDVLSAVADAVSAAGGVRVRRGRTGSA